MLRVSPFLIFYAEFLLIAQFIWGMDLTNKEILTISFNIEHLDQIGFVKSPYAFKPLAIKVSKLESTSFILSASFIKVSN